jgi:hypothetical protein
MTALTKSKENKNAQKHPSLGVVFNDGSLTMFYVYNKAKIEKRGL